MRISSKLYLGLLLPLALLTLVGAVLLWAGHRISRNAQQEAMVDGVTRGTFELNLLTYEHLRRPTERTRQQWQQKHRTLRHLLATVEFSAEADRVALQQARRVLGEMNDIFADLLKAQQTTSVNNRTATAELKERLVGQLLSESQSLIALTSALSRSCDRARVDAYRQAFGWTILLVGLTALGLGLAAWWISRGITAPLSRLRQSAEQLAGGQLEAKIPDVADDEIGDLARAFNAMAASLQRRAEERDKALAALRLDEERLETLLRLNQMSDATLNELTDFALEKAVALTGSKVGYMAFVNEDETVMTMHAWSRQAMAECAMAEKPRDFKIKELGLLAEPVRQRRAVITNDYSAPHPAKKGYPEGHVAVRRHMSVPIFDGGRIVLVAGVGNKDAPYDESDVRQLTLLMQGMWRLLQHRRAEEDLRKHRDHLEELVASRTAELKELAEALARSNAELEQFAYVASHDLQEPLRVISGFLQLLQQRCAGKLGPEAEEYIQYAVEGSARMRNLIRDLLEYSRVGRRREPLAPVNCNAVVQTVLANLQPAIVEQRGRVTVDPLPVVLGDATELTQLFQNLIANALKFHGPEPPEVHVSAREEQGQWVFSVRDNGIGIHPKDFQRIFVIFQRLHTAEEYPGTGIGLALCRKIVERHGGRIWVESAPGRGSTFFFTLPSAPPHTPR